MPIGRCPFYYQFRYKAAIKEGKVSASKSHNKVKAYTTNVPVKCTVCTVDTWVWKYSVVGHFEVVHAGQGVPAGMGDVGISAREKASLS